MIYYFDTNTLITAHRFDFLLSDAPDFWAWLLRQGQDGIIKFPESVIEEIGRNGDPLSDWIEKYRNVFQAPTAEAFPSLSTVLDAYEKPMRATTLDIIQVDAYVIAHAHACSEDATVVSYERPKNATAGHNKKIPNICSQLGVPCMMFPRFVWSMSGLGA